jgi:predicted O-methyltransferase YrrM
VDSDSLLAAFEPHLQKMQATDGWLTDAEGLALFMTAASIKTEAPVVVEVGSFVGKSAICLAAGLAYTNPAGRLYCVDPFDSTPQQMYLDRNDGSIYQRFLRNTAGYPNIISVPGLSIDIARESDIPSEIDMVFIDGDHTYQAVKNDILAWTAFLGPDGILALHDVELPPDTNPDVIRVVADLGIGSPRLGWKNSVHINTLFITKRTEALWATLTSSQ